MTSQQTVTPEVQQTVSLFLTRVKQAGIPINAAYVFGSQAKGTAQPWSDIDVCVVSKTFGHNRYDERLKLLKLTDQRTIDIEPHPYSPDDLKFALDPLASEIRKFGIAV